MPKDLHLTCAPSQNNDTKSSDELRLLSESGPDTKAMFDGEGEARVPYLHWDDRKLGIKVCS